jgi:hypothetical protein
MAAAAAPTKPKKPPQLQHSAVTAAAAATAAALKKANMQRPVVPRAAAGGAVAAKTPLPSMNMASAGTRARGDRQADYSLAARTRRNTEAPAPTPPRGPVTRVRASSATNP